MSGLTWSETFGVLRLSSKMGGLIQTATDVAKSFFWFSLTLLIFYQGSTLEMNVWSFLAACWGTIDWSSDIDCLQIERFIQTMFGGLEQSHLDFSLNSSGLDMTSEWAQ